MRYALCLLLACGLALAAVSPVSAARETSPRENPADEPLQSSAVIESRPEEETDAPVPSAPDAANAPDDKGGEAALSESEGPPKIVPGDEARPKVTLDRRVREAVDHGVAAVFLDIPPEGEEDGFDAISVDKATELGRAILRYCPDGSLCRLIVTMEDGTIIRVHSVRRMKE